MKTILLTIVLVISTVFHAEAQTRVEIASGHGTALTDLTAKKIEAILAAINSYQETGEAVFPEEPGVEHLLKLVRERNLISTQEVLRTYILSLSDGNYEIQGLFLREKDGNEYDFEELVFTMDGQGRLLNVRLVSPGQNYNTFLSSSIEAGDVEKENVLAYLERFRMALNQKDAKVLRTYFADDAMIVSGSFRQGSVLPYMRRSEPDAYVNRLDSQVFSTRSEVNINFETINVFRHPHEPGIFGVFLYQYWNTTTYSDEGHLFLGLAMNTDPPQIMAKNWQEHSFEPVGGYRSSFVSSPKFERTVAHVGFTPVPAMNQPAFTIQNESFINRNKYWLIAGSAALIGTGVALLTSGGNSSDFTLPIPPGRP